MAYTDSESPPEPLMIHSIVVDPTASHNTITIATSYSQQHEHVVNGSVMRDIPGANVLKCTYT